MRRPIATPSRRAGQTQPLPRSLDEPPAGVSEPLAAAFERPVGEYEPRVVGCEHPDHPVLVARWSLRPHNLLPPVSRETLAVGGVGVVGVGMTATMGTPATVCGCRVEGGDGEPGVSAGIGSVATGLAAWCPARRKSLRPARPSPRWS